MKVFLGGTCNDSTWREELIPMLDIDYFNPVVDDWDESCQAKERWERGHADFCLYVITPKMAGVYSIAEVVEDSIKRPHRTVFLVLEKDGEQEFALGQMKSLGEVAKMVARNGGHVCHDLEGTAVYLNTAGPSVL